MSTPSFKEQIVIAHAEIIVAAVKAVNNPADRPRLEEILTMASQQGWGELVTIIRKIVAGERSERLLAGLDDEDSAITEAILKGIQDPSTLPDPNAKPDPSQAAPGLAHMISEASKGQPQALEILSHMADQMTQAGGDMARIGGNMKRLLDGERRPEVLCKGMGAQGESLMLSILEELGRLELH